MVQTWYGDIRHLCSPSSTTPLTITHLSLPPYLPTSSCLPTSPYLPTSSYLPTSPYLPTSSLHVPPHLLTTSSPPPHYHPSPFPTSSYPPPPPEFGRNIEKDVIADTSGHFKRLLVSMLTVRDRIFSHHSSKVSSDPISVTGLSRC